MNISFLESGDGDPRARLTACGVVVETLAIGGHQARLDALGYPVQDEVQLSPETENLEAICDKFKDEHLHTDDEVRFVIEGAGIFDIRDDEDVWIRVVVEPGDLIVVPKDRYHRFFLTDEKTIRCKRLFKDSAGWTPHYREAQ